MSPHLRTIVFFWTRTTILITLVLMAFYCFIAATMHWPLSNVVWIGAGFGCIAGAQKFFDDDLGVRP